MPTYQYVCTGCGEPLEAVQSFTDDPLTQCPACAGRLRKVFSAVGVVFKGSGFYRNDSRAGNGSKQAATNGSSDSKDSNAGSTSESTSGSKPDSKSSDAPKSGDSSSASTTAASTSAA